jgi:alcohol dehydrogenase (cytochrome c)
MASFLRLQPLAFAPSVPLVGAYRSAEVMKLRTFRPLVALIASLALTTCGREEPEEASEAAQRRPAPPQPRFTAVTDAMLTQATAAGQNWVVHGGAYNNQRYSSLSQINRTNVADLVPVWIYQTGIAESFQTTPIVVDNTMYISTPESHVVALNAATGEKLWEFVPRLETTIFCCGPSNRGVAVYRDKVYVATLDAHLLALDNRTGRVVWDVTIADSDDGYGVTMAPLAFDGKVVVGVSGGKYGIRGFVAAYDADTGKEAWRWHTIPAPGEGPGRRGWVGEWKDTDPYGTPLNRDLAEEQEDAGDFSESWRRGGGAVWTTPAYDPQTRTLYVVVGSPAPPLDGSRRPGDNLYTGSIVALDAQTGNVRWYFQYLPHDRWDLSGGSPPFLFTWGARTFVGHAGKTGWLYVVDAATGAPAIRSDNFVPQENLFAPPGDEDIRMAPGANGGSSWSPVAYSPTTGLAYVLGIHQPMAYRRAFQPYEEGRLWLGGSFRYIPGEVHYGTFSAINVRTGQIRWQHKVPVPMVGGALATAGDLVFVGQGTGTLDAFDAQSGELLWQFRLGAGVNGPPITYMVDGVQYVAVAAGGNYQLNTPRGDDLVAFALRTHRPLFRLPRYEEGDYARRGPVRFGAARQVPARTRSQPAPSTQPSAR